MTLALLSSDKMFSVRITALLTQMVEFVFFLLPSLVGVAHLSMKTLFVSLWEVVLQTQPS